MADHLVVPRRLLITEPDPARRMHAEQALLQANFPTFGFTLSRSGKLRARGVLRSNLRTEFPVKIKVPDGYPHTIPTIHAVGWDPTCPHVYVNDSLCIMKPEQWKPFYSIALVVAKTALWLNKFEVYQARGYWPGNEQEH